MIWPWGSQRKRPIFLCHGCFDLLHVGHLAHLLEVKRLASRVNGLLYVSVTPDEFVNKGPGRPLMPDEERRQLLDNLKCVDYAFVGIGPSAEWAIYKYKPRWYCKGQDYRGYEGSDRALAFEIDAVRAVGGDILYTTEPVRHSTDYLERYRRANSK